MKKAEFDKIFRDSLKSIESEVSKEKLKTELKQYADEDGNFNLANGIAFACMYSKEFCSKLIYEVLLNALPIEDS